MKKLFIIAAAACVALASCVKNEPVQTPDLGEAIKFDTPIVAPATKADQIVNFTGSDFGVWAHHSEAAWTTTNLVDNNNVYIPNQEITKSGDTWTATNKYWLKEKYLHFIAYAPHAESGVSVSGAGIAYDDYKITPNASEAAGVTPATDIMFSERVVNKKSGPVELVFNHALAALNFNAKITEGNASFAITKIVLKDVNSLGDFSQGLTADATAQSVAKDNNASGVVGGWTTTVPVDYVVYNGSAVTLSKIDNTSLGSEMLLLPQVLGATSEIEVFYTMDGVPMSTTCSLKDTQWSRGYRYTYSISFGSAEITFTPKEVEWVGEGKSVTIQ